MLFANERDSLATQNIPEVCVFQTRNKLFKEDKFILKFDSIQMLRCQNSTVVELLQQNSAVLTRFYGSAGAMSSITMRGTSSSQTQVSWNGFPLNSLTSGDVDFSLLNTIVADQIQVINGAHNAINGSGSFGGAIELNNIPDWNNKFYAKLSTETGIFDNSYSSNPFVIDPGNIDSKKYSAKFKIGNKRFQTSLGYLTQNALNEYPLKGSIVGDPNMRQSHNKLNFNMLVNQYNYKLSDKNSFEASVWWQWKAYQIPSIGGYGSLNNPFQADSSLYTYLKWTHLNNNYSVSVRSGWFYNYLHYTDDTTNSKIANKQWCNDASFRLFISEGLLFDGGIAVYHITNSNNNYINQLTENWYMFHGTVKYIYNKLTGIVSIRRDYLGTIISPLQASFGLQYKVSNDILIAKGSVSNRFRSPTYNDKYWKNYGNPNLKPEHGWGFDFGFEGLTSINSFFYTKYCASIYSSTINDWIQWVPVTKTTRFQPINYKNVWARGFEISFEPEIKFNKNQLKLNLKYNYSPTTTLAIYSTDQSQVGQQLMMVPRHSFTSSINFLNKYFDILFGMNSHGKSYSTNNGSAIPIAPFQIYNISIGSTLDIKTNKIRFDIKVSNLFDKQYNIIPDYPMPGRAFYFSLSYIFSKNN